MTNIDTKQFISVFVVTLLVVAGVAPAVLSVTESSEEVTTEITYGNNSLDPYTVVDAQSTRGDVDNAYKVTRGTLTWSDAVGEFTADQSGNMLKIEGNLTLALSSHEFYLEPQTEVYATFNERWGSATVGAVSDDPLYFTEVAFPNIPMNIWLERAVSSDYSDMMLATGWGSWNDVTSGVVLYMPFVDSEPVSKVVAGYFFTYYITTDGALYGMGNNSQGQMGNGTTTDVTTPYQIASSGVTDLITSQYYAYYITTDGALYGIGDNADGQMGNGTTTDVTTPYEIASGVTYVATSNGTTYYITTDGALYGMGNNYRGQMGNGTTANVTTPYQIASSGVTDVVTAANSTYYIQNGALYGIGYNNKGQMGNGTTANVTTPYQIASSGVTDVWYSTDNYAYYIQNGALYGMGNNNHGQIGNGTKTDVTTPYQIASSGVTYVATANYSTYYITTAGALFSVGYNWNGQMGNGTTTDVTTPYEVAPSGVTHVVTDGYATYYITTDGALYGMGSNSQGQMGNGTSGNTISTPYEIASSGVVNVATANGPYASTYYITTDGALYGMGNNGSGQLGNGTTTNVNTPYQIALSGVTDVANYTTTAYYIQNGVLYGMGSNGSGQIGNGTSGNSVTTPYQITKVLSSWYGKSTEFVFTENANGLFLKLPALVISNNRYYIDDGQTYYGQNGGYLASYDAPDTSGLTGIEITFTADPDITDVYEISTASTSGFIVIPTSFGPDGTNPDGIVATVYTPVRGTISEGAFTEAETGDYMRIQSVQILNNTYNIGNGRTYYVGAVPEDSAEAPSTEGVDATLVFTANQTDANVYDVTATVMDEDDCLFIPYTVSYEQTETVVTEGIPLGGLLVTVILLLSIVLVANLLVRRGDN